MKTINRQLCMVMTMLCLTISSLAYDFEVDGFYYDVNLEEMTATMVAGENKQTGRIIIPSSVTYKDRTFTVTAINGAFAGNHEVTWVYLPPTVISLGPNTFNGCNKLISVSTLNNIVEIGEECFSGCEELATIVVSNELKAIGSRAFNGCKALNEFIVPEGVDSIGVEAFQNCTNLSTVVLPSTITYIPNGLFKNCESLVNLEIPSSITIIKKEAFSDCKSLTSIVIPANVKKIDDNVFNGCSSIKSVKIEDSEEPISLGIHYIHTSGGARRDFGLFYNLPVNNLYLGRDLDYPMSQHHYKPGVYVYEDGFYEGPAAFQSCPISEVTIGESVSKISPFTFYKCSNLKEVSIPSSVTSIGRYAFAKSGIRTFTIVDGLKEISFEVTYYDGYTSLFMGCNNLKDIKLGRDFVASQKPAFNSDDHIHAMSTLFPKTVENIEIGNFVSELSCLQLNLYGSYGESLEQYPNLKLLKLGCCIGFIPRLANNKLLEKLIISSPIPVNLSSDTFSNSQYMDLAIAVPAGYEDVYKGTEVWNKFWNISTLENLTSDVIFHENQIYGIIEENNIGLLKSPFLRTQEYITVPQTIDYDGCTYSVTSIGTTFKKNSLIQGVDISAPCIENLDSACFKECRALKEVRLGDGLITIPNAAFYDCYSLVSINIPPTIKAIGDYSFYHCKNINTLSIPASVTSFGLHAFENSYITNLRFEDGDDELDLPPSEESYDDGYYRNRAYFAHTIIHSLYLGRNIKDKDIDWRFTGMYWEIVFYDDPFYENELHKIEIGENVTRIGSNYRYSNHTSNSISFGGRRSYGPVIVKAKIPPVGADFTYETYQKARLSIPSGTKESYKNADGWKEFDLIEENSGMENIIVSDNSSIEITFDGIIFQGEHSASVSIHSVDGKCLYSGTVISGQSIALSKGIYIVKLDGKSIKVKI